MKRPKSPADPFVSISRTLAKPSVNWRGSPPSFVTQYFEISSGPEKYQIKTVAIA